MKYNLILKISTTKNLLALSEKYLDDDLLLLFVSFTVR